MPQTAPIYRNISRLYKAKLISAVPVWHKVMQKIPPPRPLPRAPVTLASDSALPFERPTMSPKNPLQSHYLSTLKQLLPSPPKQTKSNAQKHLRPKKSRPPTIMYPEDSLRKRFYNDHPFELTRPTSLVELDNPRNALDWTKVFREGQEVTGEHVVQYQLYLISQGDSVDAAYRKACTEFYNARMRQEEQERQHKLQNIQKLKSQAVPSNERLEMSGSTIQELKLTKPCNYQGWVEEEVVLRKNEELWQVRAESMKAVQEETL
ncbi:mitochondrial ribosomal protein S25-domain-containing protein [Paraphysoderma sedebokerense]|nr:mitochondrial ribosomal protein S25-domain-containing protein [Paraphysoderma sedebokerense]